MDLLKPKTTAMQTTKPTLDDDSGVKHILGTKKSLLNPVCLGSTLQYHQTFLVFRHIIGISDQNVTNTYNTVLYSQLFSKIKITINLNIHT